MTRVAAGWQGALAFLRGSGGASSVVGTIVSRGAIAVINLGTGVVTARSLGAHGRGEQSVLVLWPTLLAYFFSLGIPTALRYVARREPADAKLAYTTSLIACLALSALSIVVGIVFLPAWLHEYPASTVHAAQIFMIFSPEVMVGIVVMAMLETNGEFRLVNRSRIVLVLSSFVLLCAIAGLHFATPEHTAAAYLLPNIFTSGWLVWHLRHSLTSVRSGFARMGRRLCAYGLRAYPVELLGTLSLQVDQVLVIGLLKAEMMGVYVVALSASRVLGLIPQAVSTVVFQRASALEADDAVALIARGARASLALGGLAVGLLILALPLLLPGFFGPGFRSGVPIAQILCVEGLLSGLVLVLSQSFLALGRPATNAVTQIAGLLVTVPLMLLLIPRFGLEGAAFGLLLSSVVRLISVLTLYPVVLKMRVPPLIPTVADLRELARAARSGGAA